MAKKSHSTQSTALAYHQSLWNEPDMEGPNSEGVPSEIREIEKARDVEYCFPTEYSLLWVFQGNRNAASRVDV